MTLNLGDHQSTRRDVLRTLMLGGGTLLAAAACGKGPEQAVSQGSGKSVAADATGTLNVWHYSTSNNLKAVEDYTAAFTKKYPKVDVKLTFVEFSEMPKRAIAAAGARSGPDVFIYGGNEVLPMYQAGVFREIDTWWSKFPDRTKFPDGVQTKFDGKLFGVKGYVNLTGLWYNKDIIEKVGVEPPTTFEDTTPAFEKVAAYNKANNTKYVPLVLTGQASNQGDWTAWPWLSGYGFSYDNPDEEALRKTFTLVNTWARNGYLPKDAVNWAQAETFTRFAVGDVAFMENGNWNIGPAKREAKFAFGTAQLPKGPNGGGVFLGGEALWMGKFTKSPDLAWTYMSNTLFSKEGLLIAFRESGTVPARSDMTGLPEVTKDPLLQPYLAMVSERGSEYPPAGGKVLAAQAVVAQNWSAVIAGQKPPEQAAKEAAAGVKANSQ